MIARDQLTRLITDTLLQLNLYSEEALMLLIGTAAQESKAGTYIYQLGNGPARGIFQMEPFTEKSLWNDYLAYKKHLRERIKETTSRTCPGEWLTYDLAYQVTMARIHYLRVPEALPTSLEGAAHYWKLYYNTPKGRGTVAEFIKNYEDYKRRG